MASLPFETAIKEAIGNGIVTGASLAAVYRTKTGEVKSYTNAFGKESLAGDSKDMKLDSLLWIASCTKLLTAVSVLQLVDKGLLALDDPLDKLLPEYAPPIQVINPSAASEPLTLSTTDRSLTLRQLLTHTSGLSYEFPGSRLVKWRSSLPDDHPQSRSKLPNPHTFDLSKEYTVPLVFPPGEPDHWEYGCGVDWAGKIVERVNPEGLKLGEYQKKYIIDPLGMNSTTYRPLSNPDLAKKVFPRTLRLPNGGSALDPMKWYPHIADPVDDAGGAGLYSTAEDYIKLLAAILADDGKLLPSHMLHELFRPQLPQTEALQKIMSQRSNAKALVMGLESPNVRWNHGLGGLVGLDDIPGKMKSGVLVWSGLANCWWWIDREGGTAGFYGSQLFPNGDYETSKLYSNFQRGIHEMQQAESS